MADLDIRSPLSDIADVTLGSDVEKTLTLTFDESVAKNGQPFGGLVIITFEATNTAGETRYLTYFAA